jgi:hypothetical protein
MHISVLAADASIGAFPLSAALANLNPVGKQT